MFLRLLILFVAVPFVELYLLLRVSQVVGPLPTVGLVIMTGVLGAALAKHQGLRTITRIQEEMSAGRMPTTALADGAMILMAAGLLITPGILTDLFGFSLLIPPIRAVYRRWFLRNLQGHTYVVRETFDTFEQNAARRDQIIDSHVIHPSGSSRSGSQPTDLPPLV